jgi:hypothetical protein
LAVWLAACASNGVPDELRARPDGRETAPPGCGTQVGGPDDLTAEPPWTRSADLYRWRDERGCPIRVDVITHFHGDDQHCDMGSVEIIRVGSPLGTSVGDGSGPGVRTSSGILPTSSVPTMTSIER